MYNLAPAPQGMPPPAMPQSQALSVAQEQAALMAMARDLGSLMFKTQFKPKWAENVEAVQYVCLYALSLGIPPVQAFSAFYVIPGGVPALTTKGAAALIASKGGAVTVEKSTDKECVLLGQRPDGRETRVEVKLEQFRHLASKDNWAKYAQDMLYAACFRRLANRLFPDVLQGLDAFDPREFDEEGVPVSRAKAPLAKPERQVELPEPDTVDVPKVEKPLTEEKAVIRPVPKPVEPEKAPKQEFDESGRPIYQATKPEHKAMLSDALKLLNASVAYRRIHGPKIQDYLIATKVGVALEPIVYAIKEYQASQGDPFDMGTLAQ